MNRNDLERTVRQFFIRHSAARLCVPRNTGNLYELYVYTVVCKAAVQAGFAVVSVMNNPHEFHFRCSPGPVNSAFSYFLLTNSKGGTYQLRNGIEVRGHSMMRHEADIALFRVPSPDSTPLALFNELVLTVECKCYSAAAHLKGEVRKGVGMVQDWSSTAHIANMSSNRHPQGCIHCGLDFLPSFATNIRRGCRPDIEQYLAVYDLGPSFGLAPNSRGEMAFRNRIAQYLTTQ